MDHRSSPIVSPEVDVDELPPVMQSTEQQIDGDSSSDDMPLRQRRPARRSTLERESSYDPRSHRRLQDHMRDMNDTSSLGQRRTAQQVASRNSPKTIAKTSGKTPKKPGPRPWASKPIKKNDMDAKMDVIREIEGYWGKGFIKSYIPKCHRPLVKRGKSGKRAVYRDHETDPKKWLPSVLKSILSLAKLTQNKAWLKKAMNDVVRYRIKNTGNRKPQLVTTDFDVLEDMLIKDWDVPYSFSIRYKHLLVNHQGQQETDEDIDHILGVGSGGEDQSDNEDDDAAEDEEVAIKQDSSEEELDHGGRSGQYSHQSGYVGALQYPSPYPMSDSASHMQKTTPGKSPKRGTLLPSRPQPPPRNVMGYGYPYPYGPPMDPWGRPIPHGAGPAGYGGYGGYNMYGGYSDQGPPADSKGRQPPQLPGYYGMGQYPSHHAPTPAPNSSSRNLSRAPSAGSNKRMRNDSAPSPFYTVHPGLQPHSYPHSGHSEVKQESPAPSVHDDGEEQEASLDDLEGAADDMGDDDSNAAALEAELRATELELKVARLQARRAALSQRAREK